MRDSDKLFPENHFDLVYSHYGLFHEIGGLRGSRLATNLASARRVLKKGGFLVFNYAEWETIPEQAIKGFEKVSDNESVIVLRKK